MPCILSANMTLATRARRWATLLALIWIAVPLPAWSAEPARPAAGAPEVLVASAPMEVETEGAGVHGHLLVTKEILTPGSTSDLVFTITSEPLYGQVGLSGGVDEADFFKTRTSRLGYFAYRPQEDYVGRDSFTYTVRNETSGLVLKNTVIVSVKAPPAVELQKFEVTADRERALKVNPVLLKTRPNIPVTQKLPNHEDFMEPADRTTIADAKIAYVLDDKAKAQNGLAKLDRATGQLTYAPNPGFIGEDRFKYYTVDEHNPQLGVENTIAVNVEPIRNFKRMEVDRSRSREVDLVFVINNSPSMAAHQSRIAENLSRFRQLFHTRNLDYRIGVLTTDFVSVDPNRRPDDPPPYKRVRGVELDAAGQPVLDRRNQPKQVTKRVASNGNLVTLPVMPQPWVTPQTPDPVFAELVKVGTNGDSNRTAFTAVYNFVAAYYNKQHDFLRPAATTIVVFFMDEEETRMAMWKEQKNAAPRAEWIENGKLPDLIQQANAANPALHQTLDGYINYWVLRPFIIAKGNQRGKLEMHAVVAPDNLSHRRAAELTGGTVLNIQEDFSAELAALGDRIADTVAVALDPVQGAGTLYKKSLRVRVDGQEIPADPKNGYLYDELTHSIRFQGTSKQRAFAAKIEITYEEHL